jgi:hypothetical protein
MGVLAVYGYTLVESGGEHSVPLNQIIQDVCLNVELKKLFIEKI